jgi:hypothetical protein
MDNTFTKIIFRIRLFFFNLIESFRSDNKDDNVIKDYFYNDESVIEIEDSETTTYLFEIEPRF